MANGRCTSPRDPWLRCLLALQHFLEDACELIGVEQTPEGVSGAFPQPSDGEEWRLVDIIERMSDLYLGSACHFNPLYLGTACHVTPLHFWATNWRHFGATK